MTVNKRLTRRQKRQQTNEVENIITRKMTLKTPTPLTSNQKKLMEAFRSGMHIAAIGSAGTGKTYLSSALALEGTFEKQEFEQIMFIRSAVQSRDQGFMPGGPTEKMSHYEVSYADLVNELYGRPDAYSSLKNKGAIKFESTSFLRSRTISNAVIIADECQNMTYQELDTIITRAGEGTRVIFCGDMKQDDLKISKHKVDVSGLRDFIRVISTMKNFEIIEFTKDDIVRSGLVKEYLIAKEYVLEAA